jgi:hypothetical protein
MMINRETILIIGLILVIVLPLAWIIHPIKRKIKPKLQIHFSQQNSNQMAANTLKLTDKAVHQGVVSVIDSVSGNALTGTLANLTAVDSDTTQDSASVDATKPNTVDVQAVTNTGGSLVNIKADFTSQGNVAVGIPDGTLFTGIIGQATLVNAIPTTPQPTLQINF